MDRITLQIDGDEYWVEGGDFEDMLEAVREIPGRRFDAQEKAWVLPITPARAAAAFKPYRLMHVDEDPLSDSGSVQVLPE